ncbi:MAG: ribonuclease HII [Deltaproteobacteria bacterium]|nr:ribonuclease HII [Deltaproteobacteria bacterium]
MSGNLFEDAPRDLFAYEKRAMHRGYTAIAGVDEAGRGALAGPVVAAAVILAPDGDYAGIDDSKKLTPRQREFYFDKIISQAVAVGIGYGDSLLVDQINILQATLQAMTAAVHSLPVAPDFLLIDGISSPPLSIPAQTIKKGDSASVSIASASIIAKVTRDRLMVALGETYPQYGFPVHKGYGSPAHLDSIASFGPCPVHRMTFRGVREHIRGQE